MFNRNRRLIASMSCHRGSSRPWHVLKDNKTLMSIIVWLAIVVVTFYRATACNATRGIAVAILSVSPSVRPSVCQMHVLWQNEIIVYQYLNTIRDRDISSLSTPTGVAGNCLFHPKHSPKVTHPFGKRLLLQISAYNVLTVRDREKVQL